MISTSFLPGDIDIGLLVSVGAFIGGLIYWRLSRPTAVKSVIPAKAPVAAQPIQPATVEPDPLPVPTQRVGIPPTALVRIHEACGGHIKDGELDIRFELRSRRDCDKMLEALRKMKDDLQRTKAVFNHAEAGIRKQLDALKAAAGKTTSRVVGLLGRSSTEQDQIVTAKLAELDGYETATRLIDKFVQELSAAEQSVQELPFYTTTELPTLRPLQPQC